MPVDAQPLLAHPPPERLQHEMHRRPGAEPEPHPALDERDRRFRRRALALVLRRCARVAQFPAAARSTNQNSSPSGRIFAAGTSAVPDSTLSRIARLPAPATRNTTAALLSSGG